MEDVDNTGKNAIPFEKHDIDHIETRSDNVVGSDRPLMTDEQSRRVCRKIDRVILPLLMWVYFLQILDKSVIGYGAIFGMRKEANLVGNQYSIIGSAGYWAQLGWQPFSAYLIVKVPTRYLATFLVTAWGISMCGLAASTNYQGLLVSRFFLGLFEAGCLPLFTVITTTWYRKSEQPLRVALWYGTNGLASILGSFLAWALSFIKSPHLYVYQILFLIVGLVTVITGPLIYWRLDNSPATARFLTEEEKVWAVERVRQNKTGTGTNKVDWKQVPETLFSPLSWLFMTLTFAINTGASVTNVFGPLIISGFGFTSRQTILLNMPFGFLQMSVILVACLVATKFRNKSIVLAVITIPCIVGSAILYSLNRDKKFQGPNLFAYYILAFLFAGNPIIVSWMASNIGGQTKKALSMSLFNAASSVGNIVGPLLFTTDQAPLYHKGLRAVLGIFVACAGTTGILVVALLFANKRKEKQRIALGKPAKIKDLSMESKYTADDDREVDGTTEDLTDFKNPMFTYIY